MPVVLDRLPLPNLKWYTGFSLLLLSCSIYYAGVQVQVNPAWKEKLNKTRSNVIVFNDTDAEEIIHFPESGTIDNSSPKTRQMTPYLIPEILSFMFHEPLCIWTLINIAYCILILLGTSIQHLVFGELRVSEQQHIKDKFWNFVFYKFIFVFGVMNVQAMDEVVLWCSWFSVLGFLHLLAQLCKDRFEYLSFSPTTPRRTHLRLLALLTTILCLAIFCFVICSLAGFHAGINTFAFMAAECILLIVRTMYVITRYSIYLWDITHEGLWEKRGRYVYMTELLFELCELLIDMVHHVHMLVWGNMLLTMASLVICMQLRLLFYQLQHKVKSHRSYLRIVQLVNTYPEFHFEELEKEDTTCAICWEFVEMGRCLPCSHLFHASCLMAWLRHDLSCPTCRHKLQMPKSSDQTRFLDGLLQHNNENAARENLTGDGSGLPQNSFPSPAAPDGSTVNSGWRYVSWLPSFSVEQNHTQLPRHHQPMQGVSSVSQVDHMAHQLQQMFPSVSYWSILEDLRHTHSVEVTIDNILQDHLVSPPPMFSLDDHNNGNDMLGSSKNYIETLQLLNNEDSLQINDSDEQKSVNVHFESCSTDSVIHEGIATGSRFSKSSEERQQILMQRKKHLLSVARKRFVAKENRREDL